MTDSEKMQEEVYDYLDGLLSGQNRKEVEKKLQFPGGILGPLD